MSVNLIEKQRLFKPARPEPQPSKPRPANPRPSKPTRFHVSQTTVKRSERAEPIGHYSIPPVTDDEEETFVVRAAIWMIVLGMTPLILFHIFNSFYPDFLWIPVTPN